MMEKAKQARICIEMVDDVVYTSSSGEAQDILNALATSIVESIGNDPRRRRKFRKVFCAIMRKTRSRRAWEWIHSAQVGIVAIPAVFGVMWLIGEIGHALGVC